MRDLETYLKYNEIDYNKLLKYGFKKNVDEYLYKKNIFNNQFEVCISISNNKKTSKLIDLANEDEYILVDIDGAVGEFVGKVREEYEASLADIINKCTNSDIFKSEQAKEVIEYIKEKYFCKLEFLWDDSPSTAIWRNKSNEKWFGLIMILAERKLKINSDKKVVVINLMYNKEKIDEIIDNKEIFPGFHMNKKSWISIKLDNTAKIERIFNLIDISYDLSLNKNKRNNKFEELSKKVYNYLTKIPNGKVVTYGQIANYLGNKGLARLVGTILHKNPDGKKYPCYKVLNSKGELAEAFVFGGKEIQKKMLEKDGIRVENYKVDLNIYQWK